MISRLRHSLFGRMVIAQALILIATAIALTLALSFLLHLTLNDFLAERLHKDALLVASPKPDQRPLAEGGLYDAQRGSRTFTVVDALGQIISQSPRPLPLPVSNFPRRDSEAVVHHGAIDAVVLPTLRDGKPAWVIVTQDRRRPQVMVDDVVIIFLRRFLWIIPAGLLLSLLANIAITASATRSVTRVARHVERIDSHNLDLRVDAHSLPLEVRPLAHATNDALDRVARGFETQGKFISDVAHDLRTPLALINLRAEAVEDAAVRGKLLDAVGRASRVVSQLMELARAENDTGALTPLDPLTMALDAVATHAPLVFRSGREISLTSPQAPPAKVLASQSLVEIVLANLIENAVRHTPLGTNIVLSVEPGGAIVVSDNGPGIAADTQYPDHPRYRRGDNARTDGAGLGLKIVERIMASHGGTLGIGTASGSGTDIQLVFPPA